MFPVAKLWSILVRQLSKPAGNYLKKRAAKSEKFRNICIYFGNRAYAFDRYVNRRFYRESGQVTDSPEPIPKITIERSVNIGTEIIGEFIVFLTAAIVITAEYTRSSIKESKKELRLREELAQIKKRLDDIQQVSTVEEIDYTPSQNITNKLQNVGSIVKNCIAFAYEKSYVVYEYIKEVFY
ncbi:Optic atrophy 3 protein (OPA3) [Babesia microti strain RI]|uniref:Optic atrophy 3 protein (OPA3) n=1 Tax=Babesia microti (strain RI) TaxID=1133968 RepID=A0A1N6LYB9_BABMR|nr:Optic atrophy 3 protein (OPA3) [Babesia microti strain RI]SIO73879.1 Optic atrophy 3 protein (OPA3) [Babesia microti strain RI]|eukprot:XP_021337931.1 Optic atrophy 3 protein (OPA3) [Babesia microti strain RI]